MSIEHKESQLVTDQLGIDFAGDEIKFLETSEVDEKKRRLLELVATKVGRVHDLREERCNTPIPRVRRCYYDILHMTYSHIYTLSLSTCRNQSTKVHGALYIPTKEYNYKVIT